MNSAFVPVTKEPETLGELRNVVAAAGPNVWHGTETDRQQFLAVLDGWIIALGAAHPIGRAAAFTPFPDAEEALSPRFGLLFEDL